MANWEGSADSERMDDLLVAIKQFKWAGTKDGHLYWDGVYNRLLRMRKNLLPKKVLVKIGNEQEKHESMLLNWEQWRKMDHVKADRSNEYACDCLLYSFNWANAPGGNYYWNDIYKKLCRVKHGQRAKEKRATKSNV